MVNPSSKPPVQVTPIASVVDETLNYIEARRNGSIKPLRTGYKKFNQLCGGGIDPNSITCVVGISGSGKSSYVNTLETDLILLNPDEDVVILSFSFEMLSSRQVGRKLSNRLNQSTSDLYSSFVKLDDGILEQVKQEAVEIAKLPIYYVDKSCSVSKIAQTIEYFQNEIAKDKWLVVIIDHTLLVNGDGDNDSDRAVIASLQKRLIDAKKIGKTSIIEISQMNRNCESIERINNPTGHFPLRSDLSSSDSIFQACDIVVVLSRPELLNITNYGPLRLPTQNRVYAHFLKVREGMPGVIVFENQLKYNKLVEL